MEIVHYQCTELIVESYDHDDSYPYTTKQNNLIIPKSLKLNPLE